MHRVAGLLLIGCLSFTGCAREAVPTAEIPVTASAAPPAVTESPAPTASPVAPPTPSTEPDPALCSNAELQVVGSAVDAALGYRQIGVTVTNVGARDCDLPQEPRLITAGPDGLFENPSAGEVTLAAGQRPRGDVPLAVGESAVLPVGWRGDKALNGVPHVQSVWLAAADPYVPVPVQLTDSWGVVDGTELRVGPWLGR